MPQQCIFDRQKSIRYSRPRMYNVWEYRLGISTFQIWLNYPASVGFLPEPDLEKVPDSGQSQNPVQPYPSHFRPSVRRNR